VGKSFFSDKNLANSPPPPSPQNSKISRIFNLKKIQKNKKNPTQFVGFYKDKICPQIFFLKKIKKLKKIGGLYWESRYLRKQ
jgi:hypothetical protein